MVMEALKLAIPTIYNFTATSVTIPSRPVVQCSYRMPYKIQTSDNVEVISYH